MKKKQKTNGIQLLLRAVVTDSDGKIVSDTGRNLAKSFVIQFLEYLYRQFDGLTGNATSVIGAEQMIYEWGTNIDINDVCYADAPIHISTHGIVVGTGDTAETNTDYKLETQLTEGAGAGNITHNEMDIGIAGVVGINIDLELKRSFSNNTGSTITVKECGIYIQYTDYPAPPRYYHCIIRDVLAPSVEVPDKCSITIYYTLRTTV